MPELLYPIDCQAPVLPAAHVSRYSGVQNTQNEEMFPVVDEYGVVKGRATRSYCHSGSHLLHPVVHLHIINRKEEVYLQKRSARKEIMPGRWDTAVGGHVIYGENIMEALVRESQEELNFSQYNPICFGSYKWETNRDSELVYVFAAVGSFPEIRPDRDEVEDGRWWTMQQIESQLDDGIFTENFTSEFRRVKKSLLSLL